MRHKLAHLLGWNTGTVVTKVDSDGWLWVGFQCSGCGEIQGKHKTKSKLRHIMSEEKIELTADHVEFLNDLRDSGNINMFGSVPYIQDEFDVSKKEAEAIMFAWMKRNT